MSKADLTAKADLIPFSQHGDDNYIYNGSESYNNLGQKATDEWFESVDTTIRPSRNAKEEARQEANKEVMTMVGSMLAAIQAGGGTMPVMNKTDVAVGVGMKSISDEESEDYEEDEALVQNALSWMERD